MRSESETLELKRSTSELKEGVISVTAILNKHRKGELYFGVRNDGAVLGQTVSEQTLRDVSRTLSERIEPRIYPKVEQVRLSRKDCIRVRFVGEEAPYLAFGRAYIRVGEEDRQLSARELERLFLNRNRDSARWESELSDRRLSDVDAATVRRAVKKANLAGRLDFKFESVKATLNKLHLVRGGRLLKAAEALFCADNPLRVKAALFAGTDKTTFLDIKEFEGTIFSLLDKAAIYVKEHIDWRVKFGKLEREEIPEVPIDAVREALVNSLCHRDNRIPTGNEVAVFKDRLEIYNPGDFPEGYRPDDFIKGHERSILRNPLIAGVLFKTKDIEKWGSGLKRISKECAASGVRVEFKVLKSGFLVTFRRKPAKDLSHSTVGKTVGNARDKISALIKSHPDITVTELARRTGLSVRGIEWNIQQMRSKGKLRRIGSRKTGRWEVLK